MPEVMRHKASDFAILDVMLPDGSSFALDAEPGAPHMTVRGRCGERGIGLDQGKGRLQALVDAAGS